jgi:OOP family OmpA-OmpF porin
MSFLSRSTWALGAAAIAWGIGAASPASAAMRPELGVIFGVLFPDEELTGSTQDSNDVAPIVGLRGGLRMSDLLGLFVDGVYIPVDPDLPIVAGEKPKDGSEKLFRGGAELYGPPHWGSGESFISGAGGIANIGIDGGDGFTSPMASLGVGQVYKVSPHGRFRWEVRGERIFVGDDEIIDDDMHQVELLIGGSYMFGGDEVGDEDGDGVLDDADACPGTPSGWPVDSRGCPTDGDGDGVEDGKDKCPGTPRGATVDANGCPGDEDLDGVFDGLDRCPGTPAGTKVDAAGCPLPAPPKPAPLFTPEKKTLILEGVQFESNKAVLTADSRKTLDMVAESLIAYPDVHVEVGGHTDSQGPTAHNLELSKQRARVVADYLQSKGVAASQLKSEGFGESQPIADNGTAEGRAKNRRTELKRTN